MKAIILDDDPLILSLLANVLHRWGFEVEMYCDPTLCPLYSVQGSPGQSLPACPQVIVTDLDMPCVSGIDFIESVYRKGYRCPYVALISGNDMPPALLARTTRLNVKIFAKPFHVDQIKNWLDEIGPGLRSDPGRPPRPPVSPFSTAFSRLAPPLHRKAS